MLPCIACTKHVTTDDDEDDEDEEISAATPSVAKVQQAKSFASQLKDVVLKISSGYKQCRPCASFRGANSGHNHGDVLFGTTTSDASSSDEWSHHLRNSSDNHAVNNNGSNINNNNSNSNSSSKHYDPAGRGGNLRRSSVTSSSEGKAAESEQLSKVSASSESRISNETSIAGTKVEAADTDDGAGQEWVAQVEPGVLITFLALPNGENELRRIRFSRDLFNKWQAEAWWSENCERVHELYNVCGNDRSKNEAQIQQLCKYNQDARKQQLQEDAGSLKEDEVTEWVEEDEPGVYITIKVGPNGRELKRVRFSREKFSEKQAKLWWEKNRFRVHDQYL